MKRSAQEADVGGDEGEFGAAGEVGAEAGTEDEEVQVVGAGGGFEAEGAFVFGEGDDGAGEVEAGGGVAGDAEGAVAGWGGLLAEDEMEEAPFPGVGEGGEAVDGAGAADAGEFVDAGEFGAADEHVEAGGAGFEGGGGVVHGGCAGADDADAFASEGVEVDGVAGVGVEMGVDGVGDGGMKGPPRPSRPLARTRWRVRMGPEGVSSLRGPGSGWMRVTVVPFSTWMAIAWRYQTRYSIHCGRGILPRVAQASVPWRASK